MFGLPCILAIKTVCCSPHPQNAHSTHSMFGLPCIFAIKLLKLTPGERAACGVLSVVAVALSSAGLFSSVQQLVEAFGRGGGKG